MRITLTRGETVHESVSIIDKLHRVLEGNDGLADRLERSLVEAHAKAQAELNPAVFDALDWPTDLAATTSTSKDFCAGSRSSPTLRHGSSLPRRIVSPNRSASASGTSSS